MSSDPSTNLTDVFKNLDGITYPWHETESLKTMRPLRRNLWLKKKCTDFQQIARVFDHVQAAEMSRVKLSAIVVILLVSYEIKFGHRFGISPCPARRRSKHEYNTPAY
jgi:hypothetical protein